MWDKISQSKGIFCEPRSGRKEGGTLVHCICTVYNTVHFIQILRKPYQATIK